MRKRREGQEEEEEEGEGWLCGSRRKEVRAWGWSDEIDSICDR